MPHPMAREVNCLICNFIDINENLKNKVKTVNRKNTINILISDKRFHQTTIVTCFHVFISSVIQFDKCFHLIILYENYLIFIFMNININLLDKGKTTKEKKGVYLQKTHISAATHPRTLNLISN